MTVDTEQRGERTDDNRVVRIVVVCGAALAALAIGTAVVVSSLPGAATPPAAVPADATGASAPHPRGLPTLTPLGPPAESDATRTSDEVENPGAPVEPKVTVVPEPEPLLDALPPASASTVGGLVEGFPAFLPVADGSRVVTSSVSASGRVVQATLEASTASTPADVVAFFDTAFANAGLAGTPAASAGSATAVAYTRGSDSVTLTVTPSGASGAVYTLFGVVTVG